MAQDEELARAYLDAERERQTRIDLGLEEPDDPAMTGPSRASFSPEAAGLASVADWLQSLVHVQIKRGGSKPGTFRPSPRPVGAVEKLKARDRLQAVRNLENRLVAPD